MAGLGRKVFTAGDVLTASDVQNYLMDQTVMNFAGTAARSSAIATPTTGMTTYIGTTGTATIPQIETYTGSAWQTPYGLTLVASATFSATTTISLNNVFTSAFQHYVVMYDNTSGTGNTYLRLRQSGSDDSLSTYEYAVFSIYSAPGSGVNQYSGNGNIFELNQTFNATQIYLYNPQLAVNTRIHFNSATNYSTSGAGAQLGGGVKKDTKQYDGMTLFSGSGNFAGTIRVYGYRNS
jgi:hypothetical protein